MGECLSGTNSGENCGANSGRFIDLFSLCSSRNRLGRLLAATLAAGDDDKACRGVGECLSLLDGGNWAQ